MNNETEYQSAPAFLNDLSDVQREAVTYNDGPTLIIAGAGSGKTRVLTYKIAYLLHCGIPAARIMALTFTNKAANEMKERISNLVGLKHARYLHMGTFHSVFLKILRLEAEHLGYNKDFTIYDATDTKSLLKNIVKEMGLDEKIYKPAALYDRISRAKNNVISPAQYARDSRQASLDRKDRLGRMPEIYQMYVTRCRRANAMDFDDLLYYTYLLFDQNPELQRYYQERFDYVLVDEYQDTNPLQDLIIKQLVIRHQHLCVVGDDAQSIYSFRGACIENILQFRTTYPSTKLFKLEENYRSTQNIVNAANSLIWKNRGQIRKEVFSNKEKGEQLHLIDTATDRKEAEYIAETVYRLKRKNTCDYNQMAVLYRTRTQSRALEEAMRAYGIPYIIYGDLSFYQRKEIKDALGYLRLCTNRNDEESLRRIINTPARGLGDTTLTKLWEAARAYDTTVWKVVCNPLQYDVKINKGTQKKLADFASMFQVFDQMRHQLDAYELAKDIIKHSGLGESLLADKDEESLSRYENLQELLNGIHEFVELKKKEGNESATLAEFLAEVSLLTDMDTQEDDQPHITLMTIHAAKGLEFHTVFVAGLEEQIIPSPRSISENDIEEERRLLYVAITRAEKTCYLTYARCRFRNGKSEFATPSRFLSDIDSRYLHN
ncbi:MAG: UvrD-helicase domain-containing protein, partial [Paludibacteraceae bacterium]|nr:UvrD-helicase domain-containing protein [Paludibacteraceae bacterium]